MKLHVLLLSGFFVLVNGIGMSSVSAQQEELLPELEMVTHMHGNLDRLSEVKAAIIAGDLEAAREPATWIAEHNGVETLPKGWEPYIVRMRADATKVASATDLANASAHLSMIARACGDCHVANNSEVTFGFDQKPRDEFDGRRTHMQRHLWGVDRMWDGLIGPSDIAWNRGSDFLIDVPLSPEEVLGTSGNGEGIGTMAKQVHVLGGRGTQTKSAADRSELFGELLAVCGSCHFQLQVGPAH